MLSKEANELLARMAAYDPRLTIGPGLYRVQEDLLEPLRELMAAELVSVDLSAGVIWHEQLFTRVPISSPEELKRWRARLDNIQDGLAKSLCLWELMAHYPKEEVFHLAYLQHLMPEIVRMKKWLEAYRQGGGH